MLRRIIILLLTVFVFTPAVSGQSVSKEIISAFEKGDAKKLSRHMHHHLEIKLTENKSTISKNQATRLLEDFFASHPCESFKITYEGSKQGSRYGIGELKTTKGKYRINLDFIEQDKKQLIYKLSFEKI